VDGRGLDTVVTKPRARASGIAFGERAAGIEAACRKIDGFLGLGLGGAAGFPEEVMSAVNCPRP